MLLNNSSNKKQDFKSKQLDFFVNIFLKKLKFDIKTQQNKSDSKAIKKNISVVNKQSAENFRHYMKVEKELIEYIALLNTKIYPADLKFDPEILQINSKILQTLEFLKKKRVKILQDDKNELELLLYSYQDKIDKDRTDDIYRRYKSDLALFEDVEKITKEVQDLLPNHKKLELECQKLEQLNTDLKVKYNTLQMEQKGLYKILNKLKNKGIDKKDTLHHNKSCIFKTKTKNQKFFERINKKRFFLPRKRSNYSKINFKKELPLNRCSSAKLNDRYKIEKILDENNEKERNKNMYIIRVLKELNYYATIKCNELEEICAKETKAQNNIKNLLQLCAEDLNTKNKEEKNKKKRKKLEEKIFILSYVYDNCLNNGEKKHLKRNYSMFIPKKNKFF